MIYQKKLLVALVVGTTNPQPDDIVKTDNTDASSKNLLSTITGSIAQTAGNVLANATKKYISDSNILNRLKPIQGATKDGVQVWQDAQTGKKYLLQGSGKDAKIVEL